MNQSTNKKKRKHVWYAPINLLAIFLEFQIKHAKQDAKIINENKVKHKVSQWFKSRWNRERMIGVNVSTTFLA